MLKNQQISHVIGFGLVAITAVCFLRMMISLHNDPRWPKKHLIIVYPVLTVLAVFTIYFLLRVNSFLATEY